MVTVTFQTYTKYDTKEAFNRTGSYKMRIKVVGELTHDTRENTMIPLTVDNISSSDIKDICRAIRDAVHLKIYNDFHLKVDGELQIGEVKITNLDLSFN